MPWNPQIERWRQFVQWECKDIQPDLMLAIIRQESGGIPGLVATAFCKPGPIPKEQGGFIIFDHALGLMQIVPLTIASYNERHPSDIVYFEDMKGQDERAARLQIRVGCAVYASAVRNLYLYDPQTFPGESPGSANADQLILALVGYRMGTNALRKKLDGLKAQGKPLSYESLQNTFPGWGGEINRVYHYTSTVWDNAVNHGFDPGAPIPTPPPTPPGSPPGTPTPPGTALAGFNLSSLAVIVSIAWVIYRIWKGFNRD